MTAVRASFPAQAASVPTARRFVRDVLLGFDLTGAWDVAEMLVSEIVTNAVLHARTEFTVAVERAGNSVRVSVTDLSQVAPRQRNYGTDSTTGRGLRLVATLAEAWGVHSDRHGKTVWFDVLTNGDGGRDVEAWEETVDVDALLAAFDDLDEQPGPTVLVRRRAGGLRPAA